MAYRRYQCVRMVEPGEYINDLWAGERCHETNPQRMIRCEWCSGMFCYMHWGKHECPLGPADFVPDITDYDV